MCNICPSCQRFNTCYIAKSSITSCTKYKVSHRIHNMRSRIAVEMERYGIPYIKAMEWLTLNNALSDPSYYEEDRPVDVMELVYCYEEEVAQYESCY